MRIPIMIVSVVTVLVVALMVSTGVRAEWQRHANEEAFLSSSFMADFVSFGKQQL